MNFEHCFQVKDDFWFYNTEENDTSILYSIKHDKTLDIRMKDCSIFNDNFGVLDKRYFENVIITQKPDDDALLFMINISSFKLVKKIAHQGIYIDQQTSFSYFKTGYAGGYNTPVIQIPSLKRLYKLGKFIHIRSSNELMFLDYKFNIIKIDGFESYKYPSPFTIGDISSENFIIQFNISKPGFSNQLEFRFQNNKLISDYTDLVIYDNHDISAKKTINGYFIERKEHHRNECPICMEIDENKNVLVPCGHVMCASCSSKISKCHICSQTVAQVIKIFI